MQRNTESSKLVANYFRNHVGLSVTTNDINEETAVLKTTIPSVIARLVDRGWEIKRPFGRTTYMFTGRINNTEEEDAKEPAPKTPQIMEVLAITKKGDLLVRADDGSLWKASEVVDL